MRKKDVETKAIFIMVCILFAFFLLVPMWMILQKSFLGKEGFTLEFYQNILLRDNFIDVLKNSFGISLLSAGVTTLLAFILAYSVHFTNIPKWMKRMIEKLAVLPMLLPTITYGFAIIYSFGRQGLLTKLFGKQLFDIYGVNGLVLGYVIYTLPVAFVLINNTMQYIDKKYLIVSKVMGDKPFRSFLQTILRPLSGTLAASVIQCFFLSFTDFGIPASVGGRVEVIASLLYNEMLGSVPNFNNGAVVAMIMLLPSIISIGLLSYLEKYNIRYNKVSVVELKKSIARDVAFGTVSAIILVSVLSVFAVIVLIPFIQEWPYRMSFSLEHFVNVFQDSVLLRVIKNSLVTALITAVAGTLIAYGAALVTARSKLSGKCKKIMESISLVTNTVPGMVLGIAYLLAFSGTSLQNTIVIIVVCNVVHFFSTPYLMMKNSLEKMNSSWETTAKLMGDKWIQTIIRVVTPNALSSLLEVFSYYFVNAMVTVSAIIFITGARTMVMTAKIKELQHYAEFNEVFVLSMMILVINLLAKCLFQLANRKKTN